MIFPRVRGLKLNHSSIKAFLNYKHPKHEASLQADSEPLQAISRSQILVIDQASFKKEKERGTHLPPLEDESLSVSGSNLKNEKISLSQGDWSL